MRSPGEIVAEVGSELDQVASEGVSVDAYLFGGLATAGRLLVERLEVASGVAVADMVSADSGHEAVPILVLGHLCRREDQGQQLRHLFEGRP